MNKLESKNIPEEKEYRVKQENKNKLSKNTITINYIENAVIFEQRSESYYQGLILTTLKIIMVETFEYGIKIKSKEIKHNKYDKEKEIEKAKYIDDTLKELANELKNTNHVDKIKKFPGEIDFKKLIRYIASEIPINSALSIKLNDKNIFSSEKEYVDHIWRDHLATIAKALRTSGVWKNRGKSDPQEKAPKSFWKSLNIANMEDYQAWMGPDSIWENILFYKNIRKKNNLGIGIKESLNRTSYKKALELKIYPEKPWSVRKWNSITLKELAYYVRNGITYSPHWGRYVSTCFMFHETLKNHNAFTMYYKQGSKKGDELNAFLELVSRWPKNEQGVESINKAFNAGINFESLVALQPSGIRDLNNICEHWRRFSTLDETKLELNGTYNPPNIELPEGWYWVDHTNAHKMSDKYNCCFSNYKRYIDSICIGLGHAAYRKIITKNDKGGLAYFSCSENSDAIHNEKRKDGWEVTEIRGFNNSEPIQKYKTDMEIVARTINALHPGPHSIIEQNKKLTEEEMALNDPRYTKIRDTYVEQNTIYNRTRYPNNFIEQSLFEYGYQYNDKTLDIEKIKDTITPERKLELHNNIMTRFGNHQEDDNEIPF